MSLTFLLDTNICIYIAKQKPISVLEKFKALDVGDVGMSIITYGELVFGAKKSQSTHTAMSILSDLTRYIPVLPMSVRVSEHYADIRYHLQISGKIIGNNDLWIAAHALDLGTTVVTNNEKEFNRIPNLNVENWVA